MLIETGVISILLVLLLLLLLRCHWPRLCYSENFMEMRSLNWRNENKNPSRETQLVSLENINEREVGGVHIQCEDRHPGGTPEGGGGEGGQRGGKVKLDWT